MASSTSSPDDVLISPSECLSLIRPLSDERLNALVDVSTFLGTSDGPITSKTVTAILAETSVQVSLDKTRFLAYNNKALEVAVTITPRSTWAFNNGLEGNYAHNSWKTGDAPKGVTVEPNQGSYQVWTKTTRSATDLELMWRTQIWPGNFTGSARQVEMAMSGQPATQAAFEFAKSAHAAIDERFRAHAKEMGVEKRPSSNGPTSTMFVSARRSVLLPSAIPLDEGRTSELQAGSTLLKDLGDIDLKWNRVPVVKVFDHRARDFKEMSWHQPVVVVDDLTFPKAYLNGKKELVWEFRLLELDVVGKKAQDVLASPAKFSVKRRAPVLDLTDSDGEGSAAGDTPSKPKRPRGAASTSGAVAIPGSGDAESDDEGTPADGTRGAGGAASTGDAGSSASARGAVAGSRSGGGGSGLAAGAASGPSKQLVQPSSIVVLGRRRHCSSAYHHHHHHHHHHHRRRHCSSVYHHRSSAYHHHHHHHHRRRHCSSAYHRHHHHHHQPHPIADAMHTYHDAQVLVHAHPPFWPPDARRRGALYVLEVVLPDKRTVFKIGHTNRPGKRITELAKCSQRCWGVFWLVWDRRRLETIAHEFFRSAWLGLIPCARCKKTHEEYFDPGLCGGRDGVIEGVETLLRALFWSSRRSELQAI
ncbi:hypothetical protein GGX14DRAFT_620481 [Mycena pura]|uniref:Bacteriophage T5 Orf172 DNA-binding domain-containing protein n=1 Tax=Mycena pura TaxID=153505 RepID=A0AAD6YCB6_9AGAR|nr:hypothetical protein GGX14DRAFT_620481 [Mycena pura]